MSKGTIVHQFGTKAQMLRELEETHLARQLDVLRMVWDRLAAPHERIVAIIYTSTLLQVEGDAGASRLNRTDADDSSERVFNPADLQRFSPQSRPVGGENLARPA
jgi:hypothetical protein